MRFRLIALVCALLLPAPVSAGIKESVAALALQGLVLVLADKGNELVAQNADQPFIPASVTKIVTAWLATEVLGSDYRFETRFYLDKDRVLYVRGGGLTQGVGLHFCEHCNPVPGDRIVGIVEQNRTLTVHAIDCLRLAELEDQEDLWRDLHWTPEAEINTLSFARLGATIRDAPGVLGQACTIIGEAGGNIVNLNMHHRHSDFFDVHFALEVKDARHLTHIAAALRACPSIETVDRVRG